MRRFPCGQDKRPLVRDWPNVASSDPEQWAVWQRRWPALLWGEPTGEDFDVLDIDPRRGGDEWLAAHPLPTSIRVSTRSGGLHVYFRAHPGLRNSCDRIAPGIDVRAGGGFVVRWDLAGYPRSGSEIAAWPGWLVGLALPPKEERAIACPDGSPVNGTRYAEAALRSACERIAAASIGSQEYTLNSESLSIGRLVGRGLLAGHEAERARVAAGLSMVCGNARWPWTYPVVVEKVRRGLRDGSRRAAA
jgi:hypothetical protein